MLGEGLQIDAVHVLVSIAVYSGIAAAIILFLSMHLPQSTFGPANRISLIRGVIIAVLAGFLWHLPNSAIAGWTIVALASGALILDGLDGAVARRSGTASALGARLDCELDGLLTLVLCGILYLSGRMDAYILLAGGMHYAFWATQFLKWMPSVELPSSFRRQTVGVASSLVLVFCFVPGVGTPLTELFPVAVVLMLTLSFAADVVLAFRANARHLALASED